MKSILLIALICLPAMSHAATAQIVVPVTISYQGRSVQTSLAVDTGCTVTTIDTALADQLGISVSGSGLAQLANGQAVRYSSTDLDVTVSTYTRRIRVNIMDYVGARDGTRGMLGLNFMDGMAMTIDWRNQRIYWSE